MSTWNLGADDISRQTQAFKDKLSSKDSECAALQSQLIKRNAEFNELKSTLNETLHKLSREADQALKLEKDLKQCSNDLRNEKLSSQNTQTALVAAHERIKQEELTTRDLQATIEVLSHRSDDSKERYGKLERDKSVAEARVKELETILRQMATAPAASTSKIPNRRARSSSVNFGMNQELTDVRAALSKKDIDLCSANENLARVQAELTRADNEKIALEKRMQLQLSKMQACLEEKEDELEYVRAQHGDGSASARREEELLERVEEDEAKINALEMQLRNNSEAKGMRGQWRKTEAKLMEEVKKAKERGVALAREKEEALKELEDVRAEMGKVVKNKEALGAATRALENQLAAAESVLEVPREPDEAVVAYISRLLNAVDRLRGERDQLRRNMSFLETEAKFTAEALEAQRAGAKHITKGSQIANLGRIATVFAVVISHIQSTSQPLDGDAGLLQAQLKEAINLCASKDDTITQTNKRLSELEACMNVMVLDLEAAEAQRTNLFSQIKMLEGKESERVAEVAQTENANQVELKQAQVQLADVSKTLEETEGQRASLTLQLTNTQSELTAAQRDLTDAQVRYSSLQSHQLASLSSNEATKVLRSQIEELEMRVLRRTEQIGIHQHDIKRLETNLKLSEERVGELMTEVEVLGAEKAAMVEDCADAREARDETIERVEGLEMEVEMLEGRTRQTEMARATEVGALVRIIVEAIGRSRVESMKAARNEKDARQAGDNHRRAMDDLKRLADQYQRSADRTAELEGKLQDLRQVNEAMLVDHEQAVAVLVRSREELEERLVKSERLHAEGDSGNDLESLRSIHIDEMRDLQMRLDGTSRELEAARRLHVEAEVVRKEASIAHEELVRANKDLESRADEATERSIAAHGMLAEAVSKHESEFSSLQRQLDESVHQVQQLQQKLHEITSTCAQEEALHGQETERSQRAESMIAELQQQITNSRKQLDALQAEKISNQTAITDLEAEIERLLSSERYLGDQAQSSERTISSLNHTLEGLRSDFVRADNATKAAQVQLAFQKVEHEQALASLRSDLSILKSKPNMEKVVEELKEKNREMEEMLRDKCAEVEENDDRFIEMLKEKKKLSTKIESLTRKVQMLQAKLAAFKSSALPTTSLALTPEALPPGGSIRLVSPETSSVPSFPHTATQCDAVPHTGPSSSSKPKSSEKRALHSTVFKPKTPDRHGFPVSTSEPVFPSSGKKRPYEEDHYTKIPPQGFDASSRPYEGTENSTPRMRKVLQSGHSGFTPVRKTPARPTMPVPSPRRRADTAPTRQPLAGIADVTNSPRITAPSGQPAKPAKRGWLTKIRGVSSQTPGRTVSSRLGAIPD